MTTPAYDAWLRACAEFLRDGRPDAAIYDVDPKALEGAFSLGTAPKDFLSADPLPPAITRDPSLLPFFREDVRRALATLRPGVEIHSLAPGTIEAAYASGGSALEFVERHVAPMALEPNPPVVTAKDSRPAQRSSTIWLSAAAGVCVALAALTIIYRTVNGRPSPAEPPLAADVSTAGASTENQSSNAPSVEVTQEPSPDSGAGQMASTPAAEADKKPVIPATVNPLDAGQKPSAVGNVVAAPQPSPEATGPRPSIDQFFATYSATGDDSNPWRMTLHWKATNVDRIELSYGDSTLSGTNSPTGEITIDHDPTTNGPLRPGTVYTLRGFNGSQVSTRAVTADPPP